MLLPGAKLLVAKVGEVVYLGPGYCGYGLIGCRQPILWALTARKRRIALNLQPNEHGYHIAHQATCPDGERFRKAARGE